MHRSITLSIFSFLILSVFTNAHCHKATLTDTLTGNWVQAAAIGNYPRAGAASFVVGNKAFVGLGYNEGVGGTGRLNDFWSFSLDSGWKQLQDFPGKARSGAAAFSLGEFGYVGTGTDDELGAFQDFYRYDTAKDQWTPRADFPGDARWGAVGFAVQGKGYIGTGKGKFWLNDFYQYNPGDNTWARTPGTAGNFSKREGAVSFVYNNKAYVVTGSNNNVMARDFWSFDPSQSAPWTRLADIANTDASTVDDAYADIQREHASVFVNDGKAYLTVGRNGTLVTSTWMYDFDKLQWSRRTGFPRAPRFSAVAFTIGGKSFVGTGDTGNRTTFDDFNMFEPDVVFNPND